ncbi:hypothetical protein MBM_05000 [Drepanopeziza brunnea f. sp. 'multigermtubi' MB_m1]|uniref:Uncharacterized protein n=1 Tax=Marssonina brunnea f. sp. multigermtubi (strain MB_m1) TaxID=1072389 RepID=K1WTZ8_MARBU|nr:uncharacterized protein MBM_05000 [Drepanopeziza brunnea f. sp. 'multigermtubi' MB_m1]EKD16531.1 hypothetical protein MBM_05000 [Drepanopeziza brunnea f. sp. 'multigermtubi' MB_m1]
MDESLHMSIPRSDTRFWTGASKSQAGCVVCKNRRVTRAGRTSLQALFIQLASVRRLRLKFRRPDATRRKHSHHHRGTGKDPGASAKDEICVASPQRGMCPLCWGTFEPKFWDMVVLQMSHRYSAVLQYLAALGAVLSAPRLIPRYLRVLRQQHVEGEDIAAALDRSFTRLRTQAAIHGSRGSNLTTPDTKDLEHLDPIHVFFSDIFEKWSEGTSCSRVKMGSERY